MCNWKNTFFFKGTPLKILRSLWVDKLTSWACPWTNSCGQQNETTLLVYTLMKLFNPGVRVKAPLRPRGQKGSRMDSPIDNRRFWYRKTTDMLCSYLFLLCFRQQTLSVMFITYCLLIIFKYAEFWSFCLNKHSFSRFQVSRIDPLFIYIVTLILFFISVFMYCFSTCNSYLKIFWFIEENSSLCW